MRLHRAGRKPQWATLRLRNRNYWQKLAAATAGIVTPANVISIIGLVLVLAGLADIYADNVWRGLALIAVGRVLDIVDGIVAEETGTKSPLGEALDATVDKLELAVALPLLVVVSILAPWQAISLASLHLVNAACAVMAKFVGKTLHTSRLGKYAISLQWIAIFMLGILSVNEGSRLFYFLANVTFISSLGLGVYGSLGYLRSITR